MSSCGHKENQIIGQHTWLKIFNYLPILYHCFNCKNIMKVRFLEILKMNKE